VKIKVSLWKYEFIGPYSGPMEKVFFYSAQLVLKLVQGCQENDHIHGVTHDSDLVFIPQQTWDFPTSPETKQNTKTKPLFFVFYRNSV